MSGAYFSDRCGTPVEYARDSWAMCGLANGHEGPCEPTGIGTQTDERPVKSRYAGETHRFGLWVAPGVFLSAEWAFWKAKRTHWLMVPWDCNWNDLVARVFHAR